MPFAVPGPPTTYLDSVTAKNQKLAVRIWKPSSSVVSISILIPDLGWHSGYFDGLAARLNRNGILCVAYDPLHTGYSNTGPSLSAVHVMNRSEWLDDLELVMQYAQKLVYGRNLPLFLLAEGHTVHHVLAVTVELSKYKISGVIGLSPLFVPASLWQFLLACCCCSKRAVPLPVPPLANQIGHIDWLQTVQFDPRVASVPQVTATTYGILRQLQAQSRSSNVPLLVISSRTLSNKPPILKLLNRTESVVHWTDTKVRTLLDHRQSTDLVKDSVAEWMTSKSR